MLAPFLSWTECTVGRFSMQDCGSDPPPLRINVNSTPCPSGTRVASLSSVASGLSVAPSLPFSVLQSGSLGSGSGAVGGQKLVVLNPPAFAFNLASPPIANGMDTAPPTTLTTD